MSKYDRDHEYKIELLRRCSSSREIYQSLSNQIDEYDQHCNDDSYAVDDEPYCAPWYIERHVELLNDLRQYTELVKYDDNIPEHLLYLVNFYKD